MWPFEASSWWPAACSVLSTRFLFNRAERCIFLNEFAKGQSAHLRIGFCGANYYGVVAGDVRLRGVESLGIGRECNLEMSERLAIKRLLFTFHCVDSKSYVKAGSVFLRNSTHKNGRERGVKRTMLSPARSAGDMFRKSLEL